ncbi:MAG: glycine--tRNA ligase subunit beta [Proteobacteria bacterium]|nr:glycine--tRNA ligase subunit beta [Pseudomonadota bacterium]
MPELLLELFSEEIPARMQARAAEDLKRLVSDKLKEAGLSFTKAEAYVTPRRLALVVDGLPEKQPDKIDEKKGPRVGSPEQAIAGFLKSSGLTSLDQCEKRMVGKAEFWFATIKREGSPTPLALLGLSDVIWSFPWPKSMRWGSERITWVRPLQRTNCIFGDSDVVLSGMGAGGFKTFGHRFLAPDEFAVTNFADYKQKLRDAYVILDPTERREIIARDGAALAQNEGLTVKDDKALLDEVTGLVEWPVVLIGSIDPQYMDLPPEVLTTSMRAHQKFFSLLKPDGALAPRFLVVSNMETDTQGKKNIVAGNERVLRARLSDAKFFWDQDRKVKLEARVPALAQRIFHAKLGSMGDKVARLQTLAAEIAAYIPGADVDRVRSAALLCKADLSAGMVGEFPELQGVMGRYYALAEGEHADVAEAIRDHYSPLGPNDRCPSAPVSVAVALADKIDTLVGFFAIDEKPTGSRDPFALRRAALGAIRLTLENKLRLPMLHVFYEALRFPSVVDNQEDEKRIARELLAFFADRLKVALREQGVRHDLIDAVFALGGEDDLVRLLARVDALKAFLASDDGANLLTAHRRASNIVAIEEKKDGAKHDGQVDQGMLSQAEETTLARLLDGAKAETKKALGREDFAGAMRALARLRAPIDAFFDKVTVNVADARMRANRLRLLSDIRRTLGQVADFGKIEG